MEDTGQSFAFALSDGRKDYVVFAILRLHHGNQNFSVFGDKLGAPKHPRARNPEQQGGGEGGIRTHERRKPLLP